MSLDSVASLAGRNFRAGKAFELVVFDRLPPEEQAFLAEMRADPDFYGILRPPSRYGADDQIGNQRHRPALAYAPISRTASFLRLQRRRRSSGQGGVGTFLAWMPRPRQRNGVTEKGPRHSEGFWRSRAQSRKPMPSCMNAA